MKVINIITVSKKLIFALWEVTFVTPEVLLVEVRSGNGILRKGRMTFSVLEKLLEEEMEVVIL